VRSKVRRTESDLARSVLSARMLGKNKHLREIEIFRRRSTLKQMSRTFRTAFPSLSSMAVLTGKSFPSTWAEVCLDFPHLTVRNVEKELVWASQVLSLATLELRQFITLRSDFERKVASACFEDALATLDEIETRMGKSFWLAQNRLSVLQQLGDSGALLDAQIDILEGLDESAFSRIILQMIYRRTELNGIAGQFSEELNKIFAEFKDTDELPIYFKARLLRGAVPFDSEVAILLFFESSASIVDYYEAFISSMRTYSTGVVEGEDRKEVALLVRNAMLGFNDARLSVALGIIDGNINSVWADEGDRVVVLDGCVGGDLDAAIDAWGAYHNAVPEDILPLIFLARAEAPPDLVNTSGIFDLIYPYLNEVVSKTPASYAAALSIFAITERFSYLNWARILEATIRSELGAAGRVSSRWSSLSIVSDPIVSPLICLLCKQAGEKFLKSNLNRIGLDSSVACQVGLSEFPAVVKTKLMVQSAITSAMTKEEWSGALEIIDGRIPDASPSECRQLFAQKTEAHLRNSNLLNAAHALVEGVRFTNAAPTVFPIRTVIEGLEAGDLWAESIDVPLAYEIYFSCVDKDKLSNLRYSFECFQKKSAWINPDDAVASIEVHGRPRVIAYLSSVWRPDAMKQTALYRSAAKIEDARIEVCRTLQALDPDNSSEYREEFKRRVRMREINRGATLVEQAKVYVDMAAIKRSLKAKLDGSYVRYKAAMRSDDEAGARVLAEILAPGATDRNELIANLQEMQLRLFAAGAGDANVQFDSLYSQVMSEFVSGEHGLNAYLSTRVRHGKLANALRKPLMDENVITPRSKDGVYLENNFWEAMIAVDSAEASSQVRDMLREFSESFDRAVDYVNNKVIAVSVAGDEHVMDASDMRVAAFSYGANNREMAYLQEADRNSSSFDEFIDRSMDWLWRRTDINLEWLRSYLSSQLRSEVVAAFELLTSRLSSLNNVPALRGLQDSLARARTGTLHRLNEVIDWFRRNEFYDRNDYSIDFSIQIAISIINKTLPGALDINVLKVNVLSMDWMMPGRTLDGMVDMFDVLMMNSMQHSGLPLDKLEISVSGGMSLGRISIEFRNKVEQSTLNDASEERLATIRQELNKSDSGRRAQREGRSGLLKVWSTLKSTFYSDPKITFKYDERDGGTDFVVNIEFNVEDMANEGLVG